MHIVSMSDDKFVPYYSAMLHSASLFHPDATYWLMAVGIGDVRRKLLAGFAASLGIRFEIVDVNEAELAGLQPTERVSIATYMRILTPRLLPETVDRVLLLDADLTVTDSLDPLFNADLGGMPLGAVGEKSRWSDEEIERLRLPPGATYFNAGVLVMDLAAWRAEDLSSRMLAFLRNPTVPLTYQDQSALNFVLADRIAEQPLRWNFTHLERWREVKSPAIVHHLGAQKPWQDPDSPFTALFRLHQSRTPFPFEAPRKGKLVNVGRLTAHFFGVARYSDYALMRKRRRAICKAITAPALRRARLLLAKRDRAAASRR